MNPRRRAFLLAALLGMAPLSCERSAPSAAPAPATQPGAVALRNWVLDPPVVESERHAPALRLVCTAPSATEICCALGLREQIVGRTRFCDYPPGIESVPAIGALDETDAETLLSLRPDLLLVSGTSRAIAERLERLNLQHEALADRSLADIYAAIARVGELTGRRETARRLCAGLRSELEQVARRYANLPPARILLLLSPLADPPAPPFVAGPGSFYDDLLRLAGQRNVVGADSPAYGPFSLEMIVRADPDVIIELDADGRGRPGGDEQALRVWSQLGPLRAVRERRVHVLVGQEHFVPGPRIAQSFAELCRVIAEAPK